MSSECLRIVIPGGSGQVGTMLARHFHAGGHEVTVLSRRPLPAPWNVGEWDGENPGPWIDRLEASDVCINLAGHSVNCRYHPRNRAEIYDSRIRPTRLLGEVIAGLKAPPQLWINASTATIYRHSLDKPMDEATGELGGSEPGAPDSWNFSIRVARGWEEAFSHTSTPKTRKIALRSAITMSADRGGAFDVLSGLVRHGLGGAQGSGSQMVSWVHEKDFVRAVEFLIDHEDLHGAINIASPQPLPNAEFLSQLCAAWGVRLKLPAPAWLVEIGTFLMRTESELVLKSRYVVPGKLLEAGFEFAFPRWAGAATDLVSASRRQRSKSLGTALNSPASRV
jgi:hypothetical protein